MLYITTRDKTDVYTAYRTLNEDRGTDGGYFVPFQMPKLDRDYILGLKDKTFGQNVADILNLFFSARMDGWDVDFCIGRYPSKLVAMSHRITFVENWHNPDLDFNRIVRNLTSRIRGLEGPNEQATNWGWIGIRIAVLFGVFGELIRTNMTDPDHPVDMAVPSGDFSLPMALWYGREMGLPIHNIIIGCNNNGAVWDFLHHGELCTDGLAVSTATPEGDSIVPENLERLVFATLGMEQTHKYLESLNNKREFRVTKMQLDSLRRGLYAGVVSDIRMEQIIRSVYNTCAYILDPYSALAYCALQDYRTRSAVNRPALVLTERSPIRFAPTVCKALGISREDLTDRLNLT